MNDEMKRLAVVLVDDRRADDLNADQAVNFGGLLPSQDVSHGLGLLASGIEGSGFFVGHGFWISF